MMTPRNKEDLIKHSMDAWLSLRDVNLKSAIRIHQWMMSREGFPVPEITDKEIDELESNHYAFNHSGVINESQINYYHPKKFGVSVGGFPGNYYNLRLKQGELFYSDGPMDIEDIGHSIPDPTEQQWLEFWNVVDNLNIWSWNKSYVDLDIYDGTQWEVFIFYGDKKIISEGSNDYPENFDLFLAAVTKLIGGLGFY